MKKRNLLLSFILLGTLGSCASNNIEPPNLNNNECPECPKCEEETPTQEELNEAALKVKRGKLEKALAKFNSDFISTLEATNTRRFENPFNVSNNVSITYKVNNSFDFMAESELVRFKTEGSIVRPNEAPIAIPTEEGLFNKTTNNQVFEYLNYKNELEYRDYLDESNASPITMKGALGRNIFTELNVSSFELTLEDGPINVSSDWLEDYIYEIIGYSAGIESLTATLENETLTRFDFTYKDYSNHYSSTQFTGDSFTESLSGFITLEYKEVTIDGKKPVGGEPIEALENVLAKFRANSTNYTVQYGPAEDFYTYQVLKDGDKIALDVGDIFTEEMDLGTLTWLDARLEKREDGTYEVNNVVMDEETGELGWLTNEEIIDQALNYDESGSRLPEDKLTPLPLEKLHIPSNYYDLDFASIDTRILSTTETENIFAISGDSAKYFGECLTTSFFDDSGFGIATNTMLRQLGWTGVTWKLKVVDENTIAFEGECVLDLGGSSGKQTIFGKITNPGTTDVSTLYGELPLPEEETPVQ